MSYNGSGTFVINTAGQPVVTGTVISSTAFNALTADLGTGLSTAITKDGQTATTARIPFVAGLSSALVTDTTSGSTGSIFTAGGLGIAKAVYVGTTATVAGTTDSSSTTTGAIITAGGAGVAKALFVGTTANVAGAVTLQSTLAVGGVATYSAQPIFSSLTASSAVATDASKGLVSVTNTGTGNNVLATSPTLTTPALGTPSALVGTNITGTATAFTASNVTTNANLTGNVTSVGNATTIASGVVTSAMLAAGVTGNGPAFSAYNSSSQSLTNNTFTKVSLNAENFDTNSNFDSTTNYRFTPTVAGYYAFNCGCGITGPAAVIQFVLEIRKNNTTYNPRIVDMNPSASFSTNSFINFSGATIIEMNGSSDYVELWVYGYGPGATGISIPTGSNSAYFCGNLIRNT
jgi:hypothetical protein